MKSRAQKLESDPKFARLKIESPERKGSKKPATVAKRLGKTEETETERVKGMEKTDTDEADIDFARFKIESPGRKGSKKAAAAATETQRVERTKEADIEGIEKIDTDGADIDTLMSDDFSFMEGIEDLSHGDVPLLQNAFDGAIFEVHSITPPRLLNQNEGIQRNVLNAERQGDAYKGLFLLLHTQADYNNPNEVMVHANSARSPKSRDSLLRARLLTLLMNQMRGSGNGCINDYINRLFAIFTAMFDCPQWFAVDPASSTFLEDQDDILNILYLAEELLIKVETLSTLTSPIRLEAMRSIIQDSKRTAMRSIDTAFHAVRHQAHVIAV